MSLRASLSWRLPVSISLIIAAVLAVVLWEAYIEVDATLLRSGNDRAVASAGQIANLLDRAVAQGLDGLRVAAGRPAIREFLDDPSESRRGELEQLLLGLGVGPRRVELWRADGKRLLETTVAGALVAGGPPVSLPP